MLRAPNLPLSIDRLFSVVRISSLDDGGIAEHSKRDFIPFLPAA
jgi:hypothetical protein